jgi:outer membrane protein TolC
MLSRIAQIVVVGLCAGTTWAATFTVAVVHDGGHPSAADDVARLEAELVRHVPDNSEIRVIVGPGPAGEWSPVSVAAALDAALDDPEVNVVVVTGWLGTMEAARRESLSKPVVGGFIQWPALLAVERAPDPGLELLRVDRVLDEELAAFRKLRAVGRTVVAVDPAYAADASSSSDAEIHPCDDPDVCVATLDPEVRGVVLGPVPRLTVAQRGMLIDGLSERGIATWSLDGPNDVRMGALATDVPSLDMARTRRLSVWIAQIARSGDTGALSAGMSIRPRLVVNGATAAALDIALKPSLLRRAEVLEADSLGQLRPELGLADVLWMARHGSTNLAIQRAATESAQHEATIAKSGLWPQIFLDGGYTATDQPLTVGPGGLISDGAASARLSARQIIWDDPVIGGAKSAAEVARGSLEQERAQELDVASEAAIAFLNLGLQSSLDDIMRSNLRLTEQLLDTAYYRLEAGTAGRSEVLFWESRVASAASEITQTESDIEDANITLAQLVGAPQDSRWQPVVKDVDPDIFPFLGGRLDEDFDDPAGRQALRSALVDVALERSPDLKSLDSAVKAQEIQRGVAKRRFYLPYFFAEGAYRFHLEEGNQVIPDLDDDGYTLFLGLAFPLFEGGRKFGEADRASADLVQVEARRRLGAEQVEAATRSAIERAERSYERIDYRVAARDAAHENLRIVQDRYAEGVVPIEAVAIALNQWLIASEFATITVHEHLADLIALERAISWFEEENSEADNQAFADQLRSTVAQKRSIQ